jgi:hypothetical protein
MPTSFFHSHNKNVTRQFLSKDTQIHQYNIKLQVHATHFTIPSCHPNA